MTDQIQALLINPAARTVTEVRFGTRPGNADAGFGVQLDFDAVRKVLGCRTLEFHQMPDRRNVCVIDEEGLFAVEDEGDAGGCFWQLGDDWVPIPGNAVVVGNDIRTDTFFDVTYLAEELRSRITWSRRAFRGTRLVTADVGDTHVIKLEADIPEIDD